MKYDMWSCTLRNDFLHKSMSYRSFGTWRQLEVFLARCPNNAKTEHDEVVFTNILLDSLDHSAENGGPFYCYINNSSIRTKLTCEVIALRWIWATRRSNRFMLISSWSSLTLLKRLDSSDLCCILTRVSRASCVCFICVSSSFASFFKASCEGFTWIDDSLSTTNSSFSGGGMFSCK